MINYRPSALTAMICAAFVLLVAPATAATQTVHVSLTGESEQPMAATLDKTALKAGEVVFEVKNDALVTGHEAILVKLSSADQAIVADPKTHRINEKKLETLGEVESLKVGESGTLKVTLVPGDYAIICNHKSHYELGMAQRFTVAK